MNKPNAIITIRYWNDEVSGEIRYFIPAMAGEIGVRHIKRILKQITHDGDLPENPIYDLFRRYAYEWATTKDTRARANINREIKAIKDYIRKKVIK